MGASRRFSRGDSKTSHPSRKASGRECSRDTASLPRAVRKTFHSTPAWSRKCRMAELTDPRVCLCVCGHERIAPVGRNVHGLVRTAGNGGRGTGDNNRREGRGAAMAVREFTDSAGRAWRAWDVTPDELSPKTKDEDYLAQLYHTGWIVFETRSRRRQAPSVSGAQGMGRASRCGAGGAPREGGEVVPQRKLRTEKDARGPAAAAAMQHASDFSHRQSRTQTARASVPATRPPTSPISVCGAPSGIRVAGSGS